MTIKVGQIVDGYRILSELGRGGNGIVFKAQSLDDQKIVALKTPLKERIKDDPRLASNFLREASAIARLEHPNIAAYYKGGSYRLEENGDAITIPYITMEFVEGIPFSELPKMPIRRTVFLMQKVVDAVAYAHAKHVIHRDLKPTNIILDKQNNPKILDFGLARLLDEMTKSSAIFEGSPAFAAPEQFKGTSDERTDIWTLGSILFFLLTGRPPFLPEHSDELTQIQQVFAIQQLVLNKPTPKPSRFQSQIDPYLDEICLKALAKDAKDRYQNADDFATALSQWGRVNRDIWAEKATKALKFSRLLPSFLQGSPIHKAYKFIEMGLTFAAATAPIKEQLMELLGMQKITDVAIIDIPVDEAMNMEQWEEMKKALLLPIEPGLEYLLPIEKAIVGVAQKEEVPYQILAVYRKPHGQNLQTQIGHITAELALELAYKIVEVLSYYQKKGLTPALPELAEIFVDPIQIIAVGWPYRKEKEANAFHLAGLLYHALTGFPLDPKAPELQKLPEKFRDPILSSLPSEGHLKTAQEFLDALERNEEAHKILQSGVLNRSFDFPPGEYSLTVPLRIEKNGHLKLTGDTVFRMSAKASIQCYGQITAKGQWKEEMGQGSIAFLPSTAKEGWGGIHFFGDPPKTQSFEGCLFEDGRGSSTQAGPASGGAIYLEGGKLIVKKSIFRDNKVEGNAGAVYATGDTLEIEFSEVLFVDNKSEHSGGAVAFSGGGKWNFEKCRFEDNRSKEEGGALYAKGNNPGEVAELVLKDCTFTGNRAQIAGGAIMLSLYSRLQAVGTGWDTNIADESGAALSMIGKNETTQADLDHCKFSGNRAQLRGGAISAKKDTQLLCKTCRFDGNSADRDSAGAISLDGKGGKNPLLASFVDTVFSENRCRIDGGAINANVYTECTFEDCRFDGNSTEENSAGALFLVGENKTNFSHASFAQCHFTRNRCRTEGGAVKASLYSKISFEDCRFKNNTSDGSGGALEMVGEEGTQPTEGHFTKSLFLGNRCKSTGGAINALDTISLVVDDCQFENNRSEEEAGAIQIKGANSEKPSEAIFRNTNFSENRSKQGSGAIHLHFFTRAKFEQCRFKSNYAEGKHGGAIQIVGKEAETPTEVTFTDAAFLENFSKMDGGALHLGEYALVILDKSRFDHNKAENSGGSISLIGRNAKAPTKITLRQTNLTESQCGLDGGAIAAGTHTRMILTDCRFVKNSAESSCGAIGIVGKIDEEASKAKFQRVTFIENHCKNDGGAIAASTHAQMIFEECRFENNFSEGSCGAIGLLGQDKRNLSDATFLKVSFLGNHCGIDGGALVIGRFSRTKFEKCLLEGNYVDKKTGGAILLLGKDASFATIADFQEVVFRKNTCAIDGGAMNVNIYSQASFRNCLFEENVAKKKNGGAIVLLGKDGNCPTKATFNNVTFRRNQCNISGGALNANDYTRSHFVDCVFEENCANTKNGGAVLVLGEDGKYPSDARFTGVIFRKNYCLGSGGAVNANVFTISLFEDCVFEKNLSEDNGGGIFIRGLRRVPNKAAVKGCRFVGNIAGKIGADVALNAVKGVTEQSLLNDNTIEIPEPDFQAEEIEEKKNTAKLKTLLAKKREILQKESEPILDEKKSTDRLKQAVDIALTNSPREEGMTKAVSASVSGSHPSDSNKTSTRLKKATDQPKVEPTSDLPEIKDDPHKTSTRIKKMNETAIE